MQAVSDEQLIEWVANGDSSCLGTLFERHHRGIYQYCRQMTRSSSQAEDLVQEVFLRILRKAGQFRSDGSFKAWMYRIARNITLTHVRQAERRGRLAPFDSLEEEAVADHRSAEHAATASETVTILAQALASLPVAAQDVIWLGRFEFDSYEELGQALGCKTTTARVRMHRALQQLNAEFEAINGAPINV